MTFRVLRKVLLASVSAIGCFHGTSMAQSGSSSAATEISRDTVNDIIVTARKKDETLVSVPVVVTAVSAAQLTQRGVTNLDGLAQIVPQLLIGPQGGSVQGGNIAIRGIAGADSNAFGDQAVSFSIDGVQVSKAAVRRLSDTDIAQIEVLKGPQTMLYGKNSPGGVIMYRSADPTNKFEAGLTAGYEFNAREFRVEGYVSSPVSDTLGVRLAGVYSQMDGYLYDQTPLTGLPPGITPNSRRNPDGNEFALRGTVKWDPIDTLSVRLKANYGEVDNNGPASNTQFHFCPGGSRATGSAAQCTIGKYSVNAGYGSVLAGLGGTENHYRPDGQNFLKQKQTLIGLEVHYDVTDSIDIASNTGYYSVDATACQNYNNDDVVILPSCNTYKDSQLSQELILSTHFDAPVNFRVGGFVASSRASSGYQTWAFTTTGFYIPAFELGSYADPLLINTYRMRQKGSTYSAFLDVSFNPIPEVEITGGVRYTHEKKSLPIVWDGILSGTGLNLSPASSVAVAKTKDSYDNYSPEVTIAYHPSPRTTLFAAYKTGFLSGGFNVGTNSFAGVPDISYENETARGFEGGFKAELLNGKLRTNVTGYRYEISNLQVTNFTGVINTVRNAGAVRVQGVEFDFSYQTPLRGFSVHGAAAYNDGKYSEYGGAPCYIGQTLAQGCLAGTDANPGPHQNLSGTRLIRAPELNISGGFAFETPIGADLKAGFTGDAMHSSSYLTDATSAPNGRQPAYTLLDATARIGTADGQWTLSFLAKNLTNKYVFVASTDVPLGMADGTAPPRVGGGDRFASVGRGRQFMLRASFKY